MTQPRRHETAGTARRTADQAAIAAVIHAETLAFQHEDFEAWKECFVQSERLRDVFVSEEAGLSVIRGWTAVLKHMEGVFRRGVSCGLIDFRQENMCITVAGDVAWAVFDSIARDEGGGLMESFNTRILERTGGRWKFIYVAFVPKQYISPGNMAVGLDGSGHIVRASPECLEALRGHPLLTVSAGKLRGRKRDWDKVLQAALVEASEHHGFFETMKFTKDSGGPSRYPVILGQTDEGGVAVVQFTLRDCLTYVRIDGDDLLDRRLRFARTVFGLSEGQLKVARHIAMGDGPKGLAEKLGISVNTARTHLARLYEKTGVSSQAALVRLLLSVG